MYALLIFLETLNKYYFLFEITYKFSTYKWVPRTNLVQKQNKPIKCDVCTVSFLRNSYLKVQIKSVHEPSNHYKNKIWTKEMWKKTYLQSKIKCDICNVYFLRITYLRARINLFHEQNKPIKCDLLMIQTIYGPFMANKQFNVKIWINFIHSEPHWAILIQFDQVLTSLIHFDQVWSS